MSYPLGTKVMVDTKKQNHKYEKDYGGKVFTISWADYLDNGNVIYRLSEDPNGYGWPEAALISTESKKEEPKLRTNVLLGVSPDEPVIENEDGGKQSDTPYGFHLLPIDSLFAAARVAKYGADKYGETFTERNYTKIPVEEHINHAIAHLYAHLAGDTQDEHLAHAIARVLFAYDVAARAGQV